MNGSTTGPLPQEEVRLTQFSHGGGCGCKIAPAKLQEILREVKLDIGNPNLLVGAKTSDDAAVYKINDQQAVVLTTDFFMPVVDNPRHFGRIAAANAISDVYAMGGTPIMALSVLGMPINKLPVATIQEIINGGVDICREAGIPLAGGHSIDSPEPIFGLVVSGLVHPDKCRQNSTARPGDVLILTKPLGVGVMTTAVKKQKLSAEGYDEVLATMTQLNKVGTLLAEEADVHAMTDVTGFGLLGHLLEVCRGSGLGAHVRRGDVPLMAHAAGVAAQGLFPGAVPRNWESYGGQVDFDGDAGKDWERDLLADPQTSGGLLLAVAPAAAPRVLGIVRGAGCLAAAAFGEMVEGAPRVRVSRGGQ